MSEKKIVWEKGSMSCTLETEPPPELIEHIENTYLGTPGGLQYHHTTGIPKLKNIKDCYFLFMRRSGNILGSIGYVLRYTKTGSFTHKLWLVRYLSMKGPMRTEKRTRKKVRRRPDKSATLVKDIANTANNNPENLIDLGTSEVPQAVIFALVEKDNERSKNFAEIGGYEKAGEAVSFIFSRLRQRKGIPVEKLPQGEIPVMKKLLEDFYSGHAFYFDGNIFINGDYFVLKQDGEIVAGLQANEEEWEIKTVGSGFLDRIITLFTKIPMIGKRFNYGHMRFLGIEGIYFKKGHEKALYRLLEGVLALKDQYLALMIMDVSSPEYLMFKVNRKLGPVHTVLGSFDADIYAKFFSFPEKEKCETLRRPVYISIYDNT